MADESLERTPTDDIGSALASALAEHESAATAAAATPGKADKSAPVKADTASQSDEGSIDAAKESAEGDTASETETGQPENTPDKDAEKTPEEKDKPAASATEPPANWSAKDKELFKKQPPEVQKFMFDRHKAMEGDYIKKTQAIASFKRDYEPVQKLLEPYNEQMKAGGWTPHKLIEAWANVERRLMNPADRVNVIAGLVKGYQVDMGQLAQSLGLRPRPANGATSPNGEAPAQPEHAQSEITLPPQIMEQLQTIQARLDREDQARATEARRLQTTAEQRIMSEIDQFKSAQDDKGNLQHPHFDDVEEAMTLLAQSAIAAKRPVPPLKELYETAVWANPSTREATLAARERAQQEKANAEARAKAAAAKKAGSSVTGAPGSGQAPRAPRSGNRSLVEELEAAYADHAT